MDVHEQVTGWRNDKLVLSRPWFRLPLERLPREQYNEKRSAVQPFTREVCHDSERTS